MGLDMNARKTLESISKMVDFQVDDAEDFHYWRQHPDLDCWMGELYLLLKGGRSDFNCDNLQLTLDDLDRLEADVRSGNLPAATGFVCRPSSGKEVAGDLAFIASAREAISQGYTVYYSYWW